MGAASSNKRCAGGELALGGPGAVAVERCQRMRGRVPFWGAGKVLHFKIWKTRRPLAARGVMLGVGVYGRGVGVAWAAWKKLPVAAVAGPIVFYLRRAGAEC